MDWPANLTEAEARVLGVLLEKEMTTPEYYPLSLNALMNACNQKTNRDPVVAYDEWKVREAVEGLRDRNLLRARADARVAKYEHNFGEVFNFGRGETAILCELLVRGPQTPGELRARTERMHSFADMDSLEGCLRRLAERDPALVVKLPKLPGSREARFAQLFCGEVHVDSHAPAEVHEPKFDRLDRLERELADLRREFDAFRTSFE